MLNGNINNFLYSSGVYSVSIEIQENTLQNFDIILGDYYYISYLYNSVRYNNVRCRIIEIFEQDEIKYFKIDISDKYDKRSINISKIYYLNRLPARNYEINVTQDINNDSTEEELASAKSINNNIRFKTTKLTDKTVGGLKAGSNINGKTLLEVLNTILFSSNEDDDSTPMPPTPEEQGFDYYWGEIGIIRTPDPSKISQETWTTYLKPSDDTGIFKLFKNKKNINDSFEQMPSGEVFRWWMILVPSDKVSDLSNYKWYQFNGLSSQYDSLELETTIYNGTITLDNINYTYSAVRPVVYDAKIKYCK